MNYKKMLLFIVSMSLLIFTFLFANFYIKEKNLNNDKNYLAYVEVDGTNVKLAMTMTPYNKETTPITSTPTKSAWNMSASCSGISASWDNSTYSLKFYNVTSSSPSCSLNFTEISYTATFNFVNAYVTSSISNGVTTYVKTSTATTTYGKPVSTSAYSDTGYTYIGANISCTNVQTVRQSRMSFYIDSITANTICTITYQKADYNLSYYNNGGSGCTSKLLNFDNPLGELCVPVRLGYTFLGWFTASSGGTEVTASTIMGASNRNIYAHWQIIYYTATFNLHNAYVSSSTVEGVTSYVRTSTSNAKTYGSTFYIYGYPDTGYTSTGATYTCTNDHTVSRNGNKLYINSIHNNVTCEIYYQKIFYTVTYNNSGGLGCTNKQIPYNDPYGELCVPTKFGYDFVGWFTASTGGIEITSETLMTTAGNSNLYAQWTPINYTLAFDANGGIGACESKTVAFNSELGELCIPTREGYLFNGWFTENDGGTLVKSTTKMSALDTTLYALWSDPPGLYLAGTKTFQKITLNGEEVDATWDNLMLAYPNAVSGTTLSSSNNSSYFKDLSGDLVVSPTITTVGNFAFAYANSLTNVILPYTITSIGQYAFYYINGMSSLTLPNTITTIEHSAFRDFTSLVSINLPKCLKTFYPQAFSGANRLVNYNISSDANNFAVIDGVLFNKYLTTLVSYPLGKTDTTYTVPNTVETLGESAFYGESDLTNIVLSNNLKTINNYGLSNIPNLTSINLPEGLQIINDYAFAYSANISVLDIPSSITYLSAYTFTGMQKLTALNVSEDNNTFCSEDGIIFNKNKTSLVVYPSNKSANTYSIPNTVTSIGYAAFQNATNLTTLEIPASVTTISNYAFNGVTALTTLTLSNNLTSIGYAAFQNATNLTTLEIPASVTTISDYAFNGLTALTTLTLSNNLTKIGNYVFRNASSLTTLEIPNGITSIGNYAFSGALSLTSLTLPSSLIEIKSGVFASSNLTSVIIPASVTTIGNSAFTSRSTWTSVTIDSNEANNSTRFYDNWQVIGWPIELAEVPDLSAMTGTLELDNPHDFQSAYSREYTMTVPASGRYKLEVWGAQGSTQSTSYTAGKWSGGYAYGTVNLTEGTTVYIYVGKAGSAEVGGFNGGADSLSSSTNDNGGGGGATDIRIGSTSLFSRVIVAGGGGGGRSSDNDTNGGMNILGTLGATLYGTGTSANCNYPGSFGLGGGYSGITSDDRGAGGGGWYGGCGYGDSRGGGGSNWLYTAENFTTWQTNNATDSANYLLNSTYYLTDTGSHSGSEAFTSPSGTTETGHSGNGFARITYLGE